ncbi:hypothetical protein MVES1_003829 [Malassezia vespertilionis]|nr:uncharacterized protein MVES1_003829 [Malassezia vespertilionis]WFD08453.1 hypothetical protein MVES1_003829 [Malassezia vespertilionis]
MLVDYGDCSDAKQVEALLCGSNTNDIPRNTPGPVCRICLDGFAREGVPERILSPCRCKGTMKYVHEDCLDQWRAFSSRPSSAIACDQCGAEYKFRPTLWMRLLTSRVFMWITTLLLYVVVIITVGMLGSQLMSRYQPELFDQMHPFVVQSIKFYASPDAVPQKLRMGEGVHSYTRMGSLQALWVYLLGSLDEDAPMEETADQYYDAHMYSLGIFQPSVLVQLVQGLLQRALELACRKKALQDDARFLPRFALRHATTVRLRAMAEPAGIESLALDMDMKDYMAWFVSLGLTLLGISSVFNILLAVSIVGPFRIGAPFSVLGFSEHPVLGAPQTHARIVWESINWPGFLLLAIVLWGILRFFLILRNVVRQSAHIAMAHMPTLILDYDERTDTQAIVHNANEIPPDSRNVRFHEVVSAVIWLTNLARVAGGPAFGMNSPLPSWLLTRFGA